MTPHAIIRAASQAATKGKIRCPNCGHLNDAHAEKCARCGYPLKGAEKKAGFWGDLAGNDYRRELAAAADEINQKREALHDARRQAHAAAEKARVARHAGRPKPWLEVGARDANKRLDKAYEAYQSLPFSPETHPRSQEAWRRMFKARGAAALGLGALGLGAYGLYRATRPKQQAENPAEKAAEVEYRGHTFPGYNVPIKSSRPEKKKMVLAKKGDEVRLIHFGQRGYQHNYSDAAKKNYLARSAGIRGKGGLTKDDKFSANYWARRELWPKNEPADGTAKDRSKTASGGVSDNFAHGAELAGLGILSLPAAAHLYHNWKEKRLVSKDSLVPAAELAGLGVLSLPSLAHFGSRASKRQAVPSVTHASKAASGEDDLLLGRLGRAVGNTFQKYPAPTAAAVYGVTKLPAIGKAWREGKTDEKMPVGYAPALAAGSLARHGDPATARYLVRRAFGPV